MRRIITWSRRSNPARREAGRIRQPSLSSAEKNYSQLEKEMLAIVFALRRFDQYVYGREVLVESDHQPLETILRKPLHEAPRRLQRMMMELQRYDLTV